MISSHVIPVFLFILLSDKCLSRCFLNCPFHTTGTAMSLVFLFQTEDLQTFEIDIETFPLAGCIVKTL